MTSYSGVVKMLNSQRKEIRHLYEIIGNVIEDNTKLRNKELKMLKQIINENIIIIDTKLNSIEDGIIANNKYIIDNINIIKQETDSKMDIQKISIKAKIIELNKSIENNKNYLLIKLKEQNKKKITIDGITIK